MKRTLLATTVFFITLLSICGVYLFFTQDGTDVRVWMAGTLLTTQHSEWVTFLFLPEEMIKSLNRTIYHANSKISEPVPEKTPYLNAESISEQQQPTQDLPAFAPSSDKSLEQEHLVQVFDVEASFSPLHYFQGKLMIVNDPARLHLVTSQYPAKGETIQSMAKRTDALGGINGSGFYDPQWQGNGGEPVGLVISEGQVLQGYDPKKDQVAIALTKDGKLITGKYTVDELHQLGVRDAVSFKPQLVVNGEPMIAPNDPAWGIQPRSAIGQRSDGAILLLVIDGRQPGHSLGATMADAMNVMLEHGAVNAVALDGGSTAIMVQDGDIISSPSSRTKAGRYLPNAWLIF